MNKDKLSKKPLNIAKNQKLELFTSCHFKNLTPPKPMEESVESNFVNKFKAVVSTAHTSTIFQIFFKKIFIRKSSKSGHGNLVLILQVK